MVLEDKVLVIRRLRVRYVLRGCPEDRREAAERAHSLHAVQRHRSVAQLWHLASAEPPVRVMRASMFFDRIRSTVNL